MTSIFYCITLLASVAAAFLLASGFGPSVSAPQQAAIAGMALGCAVIPYVFSRCVQICVTESRRKRENDQVVDQLKSLERAIEKLAVTQRREPIPNPGDSL